MICYQAKTKGIELILDCEECSDTPITSDPNRLR